MIGQTLNGRYRLDTMIGEGSTAIVYRAHDLKLERDVAVKVLLTHVHDTTRKRFQREALAAAKLNHANIMNIYDVGEDDKNQYLVVELIDGRPLHALIPASWQQVCELGQQICNALDYAHRIGLIHRDIKPANIYITQGGQVKIMDFGLAIPRTGQDKRLTAMGTIIGTPAYLSPEQAQGLKLDPRTDIYSLGIVLYELLTGQLPFDADDIGSILLQQVKKEALPPSKLVPDVPLQLENVILKALEKKREARFETAGAMARALLDVLRGEDSSTAQFENQVGEDISTQEADHTTNAGVLETLEANKLTPTIRIVLADDHSLTRKSLAYFLDDIQGFAVVGQASDGQQAFDLIGTQKPDVILLDLNMPGTSGMAILPRIRSEYPTVKVLVLTGRDEQTYIMEALRAGANGYVLKTSSEEDLAQSIREVMTGRLILGRGVAERVVEYLMERETSETPLNGTEHDILTCIAAGFDNAETGRRLGLTEAEVAQYAIKIVEKMHVSSKTEAALVALRAGWIRLDELHKFS
jgi:serine/threonine protein kinase/DNA-binding CsgD family transcriptional regulator